MEKITTYFGLAEPFSSLSHLSAAVVFLYLGTYLMQRRGNNTGEYLALSVFGLSSVFLLTVSGIYHMYPANDAEREFYHRLDHAAIFVLIAGTFTATHRIFFTGFLRWGMIGLIWAVSSVLIVLKLVYFDSTPEYLSLTAYIALGWMGLVTGISLWRRYNFHFVKPLFYGGVAYSVGAVIDFLHKPVLIPGIIGSHEIFHIFVLLGIGYHWWFISSSFEYEGRLLRYISSDAVPVEAVSREAA